MALSFAFISDICHFLLRWTLHWPQLFKRFLLRFRLEVYKHLFFCLKLAVATSALNFKHIRFCCAIFFVLFFVVLAQFQLLHPFSTLGWHPTQRSFCIKIYFNPVQLLNFVRVIFDNRKISFLSTCWFCPTVAAPFFFLLGRRSLNTLDSTCFFCSFQHVAEQPGSTHCGGCNISGETSSLWWGGTTHLVPSHRGTVRRGG